MAAATEENKLEKSMTIGAGMSNMKSKGRPVKFIRTIGKEELDTDFGKSLKRLEYVRQQ